MPGYPSTHRSPRPNVTLICRHCDKPFTVIASREETARYCSRACYRDGWIGRFWAKVAKREPGCWDWQGSPPGNTYGHFMHETAHRVSYALAYGPIPDGLWVLHHCDNKRCVRPDHLFLGTVVDNVADMVQKDFHPHGSRHGEAKLTEADVIQIRALSEQGLTYPQIAAQYGVTRGLIGHIVRRIVWKHVA